MNSPGHLGLVAGCLYLIFPTELLWAGNHIATLAEGCDKNITIIACRCYNLVDLTWIYGIASVCQHTAYIVKGSTHLFLKYFYSWNTCDVLYLSLAARIAGDTCNIACCNHKLQARRTEVIVFRWGSGCLALTPWLKSRRDDQFIQWKVHSELSFKQYSVHVIE